MSGSGTGEWPSAPAEQHLGDHLAAFVDGELADDTRDRVTAHLATCPQCKDAADEQRRLKSAVAEAAPPALSAGLLARLQGLPDGGDQDGRGPFDGGLLGGDVFGGKAFGGDVEEFSFLSPGRDLAAPADARSRGFRIHEVERPGAAPVSPSRGRRLAFAAAGAFSMAAIALGGALPTEATVDGGVRPDEHGPAVTPLSATTVSDIGSLPHGLVGAMDEHDQPHPSSGVTPASLTRPLMVPGDRPITAATASAGPNAPSAIPATSRILISDTDPRH